MAVPAIPNQYGRSSYWDTYDQQQAQGKNVSNKALLNAAYGERYGELSDQLNREKINRELAFRNEELALRKSDQAFNQQVTRDKMDAAESIADRSFYGQLGGTALWGLMNYDKLAKGGSKLYDLLFSSNEGIDPLTAPNGMLPGKSAISYQTPGDMYGNIQPASYETGLEYGVPGAGMEWVPGEYGAQGSIGTGIGETVSTLGPLGEFGAALPGIGTAMLGTAGVGMAAVAGIDYLGNQIFGEGRQLSTYPTEELVKAYQTDQRSVPIYLELQNRGFDFEKNGLKPLAQWEREKYYSEMYGDEQLSGPWAWRSDPGYLATVKEHIDPYFKWTGNDEV